MPRNIKDYAAAARVASNSAVNKKLKADLAELASLISIGHVSYSRKARNSRKGKQQI